MQSIVLSSLLVILAYLLGSIPTGYLFGRYLQDIDIREHGSGSTGATNVLRTLGKGPAIAVLSIDILKGAAAVWLVKLVYLFFDWLPPLWQPWLIVTVGLVAIFGHSRSVWLNFSGGKSVATSIGVIMVMNPLAALTTLGAFGVTLAITRIVSLSSLVGAVALNGFMLLGQPLPYIVFGAIAGIYVFVRHTSNIKRLIDGTEPSIGQKLPQQ